MENENKKSVAGTVWTVIGIVLAVAGLCFIGYKVYDKFFRKKKAAIVSADDAEELGDLLADESLEAFEASADDVIVNAELVDAE